jgi:MFS family permease
MNMLSWLIYLAGVTGTLSGFFVFLAVLFGFIAAGCVVVWITTLQTTDAYSRPFEQSVVAEKTTVRKHSWRYIWVFLIMMITSGMLAAVIPDRRTVLLIAASQMGEQVLNHPRVNQVVDPGIELLTTWMQKETADLRRAQEPSNRR